MNTLIDTGPLVALFSPRDQYHDWAVDHLARLPAPLLSCAPVLTEAFHLLKGVPRGWERLTHYLDRERVLLQSVYAEAPARIHALMRTYHDVPMDLADACLVYQYEREDGQRQAQVFTTDSDFRVYRTPDDAPLRTLPPPPA